MPEGFPAFDCEWTARNPDFVGAFAPYNYFFFSTFNTASVMKRALTGMPL